MRDLLNLLHATGLGCVPRALGVDVQGREVLEYLPGEVGHYPWTEAVASPAALTGAAEVLRAFHDASAEVAQRWLEGWQWPAREPVEVICHNDYAPYNCVFDGDRVSGVIDFDTAGPGPRSWDLAYALYRFAPFTRGPDRRVRSQRVQAARARVFLDAYGADHELRAHSLADVVPRLVELTRFIREAADSGDENFARHISEGHLDRYLADIDYITDHLPRWRHDLEI